jgi:hypothetical protein
MWVGVPGRGSLRSAGRGTEKSRKQSGKGLPAELPGCPPPPRPPDMPGNQAVWSLCWRRGREYPAFQLLLGSGVFCVGKGPPKNQTRWWLVGGRGIHIYLKSGS